LKKNKNIFKKKELYETKLLLVFKPLPDKMKNALNIAVIYA